ncbi:MAG: C4-type zinc ribbon domain-containing protein [Vicinamibacterales bacterium]
MLADLERLIALQRLESERAAVARTIHDIPQRQAELDARASHARAVVDTAKALHTSLSTDRRNAEKEMASAEARRAKFRDQQASVKTNKEYQAMLHEIETANADVDKWQEQVLIKMDEVDAAAASLKESEAALKVVEGDISAAVKALESERREAETRLGALDAERTSVAAQIEDPRGLQIFDGLVKSRKTAAMSQAIDGLCIECRVRLRPQVFAEVRRNDAIRQCDNCQRILYYIPPPAAAASAEPAGA